MYCSNCGTNNEEKAQFCGNCGSIFTADISKHSKKRKKRNTKQKKNVVSLILFIIGIIILCIITDNILESGFDIFNKNPIKNTIWRSEEKELNGTFYFIKFDNKGYEVNTDWSSSPWRDKVKDDIQLFERGIYKIDDNRITLLPAIYAIGKKDEEIKSRLGDNLLLLEGDILTVMDGKKYRTFRKF